MKLSCLVTTAAIISRSLVNSSDNFSNLSADAMESRASAGPAEIPAAFPADAASAPCAPTETPAAIWGAGAQVSRPPQYSVCNFSLVIAQGTSTCVLFSSRAKSASDGTRRSPHFAFESPPSRMPPAREDVGSATRSTLMLVRGNSQPKVRDSPPMMLVLAISCAVWTPGKRAVTKCPEVHDGWAGSHV